MKKLTFLITLLAVSLLSINAFAGQSTVMKAYSDHVRRSDGMINISVRNHQLDVERDLIDDETSVNVFARNIEIDSTITADVWDGGYKLSSGGVSLIYVSPTAAQTHWIVSTSTNDTSGGTGARKLRIRGLIDWDTPEITEYIVMNGQTSVTTTQLYVAINSMEVLTKGATSSNVGAISAFATSDGTTTSLIRAGEGHTHQSIYAISSLETMYMGRLYGNANKASGATGFADVSLLVNPEPDAELTNFLSQHTFGLMTDGTSALTINYYVPKKIEGPSLTKVQVLSGTNGIDISAGFDSIIVTDTSQFGVILVSNSRPVLDNRILTTADGRIIRVSQTVSP